eukprot:snap_masked-scaffold_4-processed-gene-11.31-mRNA-1 protein AED:1.00 eAED:1.00 QI:0/0/0/0/1/1/2/0/201
MHTFLALHGRHQNSTLFARKISVNLQKFPECVSNIELKSLHTSLVEVQFSLSNFTERFRVIALDAPFHDVPKLRGSKFKSKTIDCETSKKLFRSWYIPEENIETKRKQVEESLDLISKHTKHISGMLGCFSAYPIDNLLPENKHSTIVKSKILHWWSEADQITSFKESRKLYDQYKGSVYTHNLGHKLPNDLYPLFSSVQQ